MNNDNIYPLNGEYFTPSKPDEQQLAEDAKKQATLSQLPLLEEVVKHLEERIGATDSVKQALVIATTYKLSKDEALAALDIVRQQLEAERGFILSRVKSAKR